MIGPKCPVEKFLQVFEILRYILIYHTFVGKFAERRAFWADFAGQISRGG
jgi:hypothetical protein